MHVYIISFLNNDFFIFLSDHILEVFIDEDRYGIVQRGLREKYDNSIQEERNRLYM